ncbi:MAG: pyridoxal phosphate-dependent aminotransferase [Paludibacteraceae bacterium]|nr:pyridoxal phosphate-dependent aminotransferase [Paludibacteraceae bacterium]MBR4840151.1 pyridoxal phosphate-dependent aminotransferase [Paludibacteraceae bacterium]
MDQEINPIVGQMTSFIVMDVLEKAVEMQKQGIDIIHLEVGEPDFEPSDCVLEAAEKAYADKKTHYTHSLGDLALREEISRFYKREYNVNVDPERIVVTSGSSPAILMALMVLCEAGSEVILSNPGYPCYRNFVLACNANPVSVELSASDGFQYPIQGVKAAITEKTRAIFVNSPMNPTGTLVSDETYEELAKIGIPIISDEIYHGLVYNGRARSVLEFTDNAFVLNGFSKRYAMTGLRLGYLIAPQKYMRSLQILQQNLFICAPSTAQQAGIAALRDSEPDVDKRRAIYNERRVYMIDRLRKMGFVIEKEPQGAFYIFCNAKRFSNDSYKFAFEVLENAHVGITPGIDFGSNGEGYVRFSYANSIENIKIGMDRLENYLEKTFGRKYLLS